MSDTTPWYATREDVQLALDAEESARAGRQIDKALAASMDTIKGALHRTLYPVLGTRYFDWPNRQYARGWRLWLDSDQLIEVVSITNGDDGLLSPGEYNLEPVNDGPPFSSIEINLATAAGWSSAGSHQRSIAIVGLWGWRDDERPAGTVTETLDASETEVQVSDGSAVGVGSLLRCDTERMVVTGRTFLDSGVNLAGDLASSKAAQGVAVADGTAFHVGEQLVVDAERMLIEDIAGNTLLVRRAWAGSALDDHTTGADVYVSRSLTVARGCVGTTAATHTQGTALAVWAPPDLANRLAVAEAMNTFEQERSAYARTVGQGDNEREARGKGLSDIRLDAYTTFGRQARSSAI